MEDRQGLIDSSLRASSARLRFEEDDDEFRSCCDSDCEKEGENECCDSRDVLFGDESSVTMCFKGVSVEDFGEPRSGFTGIGVVMDGAAKNPAIRVQKKLDLYVEDCVADYLALIDGLSEAVKFNVKRVLAATDSKHLYDQVSLKEESCETPLVDAFRERVFELIVSLEAFELKLVSSSEVQSSLHLAMVAIGIVSPQDKGTKPAAHENCPICSKDKPSTMIINLKCSHKFCSHCLKSYAEGKLQAKQVPIRCPKLRCRSLLSAAECRAFLPVTLYDSLERATLETNSLASAKIYCPYSNCSAHVDHQARFANDQADSSSCVECPVCQNFVCVDCGARRHSSLTCEEYQNLPFDERDSVGISLHLLTYDRRWRRCKQCWRMIELTPGSYHMTCWCGHELCYSCGVEYRDGHQTCECPMWDEPDSEESGYPAATQETEQWPWDPFGSLQSDEERSQLALIQTFLVGGVSLTDHHPYQTPPPGTDSYADAIKDLHQLPWLERFVSVISDTHYNDYIL